MISLKASRFFISYEDHESKIFVRNKDGYNDITDILSDNEKDELISDLIYCIDDLLKAKEN